MKAFQMGGVLLREPSDPVSCNAAVESPVLGLDMLHGGSGGHLGSGWPNSALQLHCELCGLGTRVVLSVSPLHSLF